MTDLLEENPNANVIIAAHSYLNKAGGYGFKTATIDDTAWCNNLKTILDMYPNVFLTLSGHDPTGTAYSKQVGNREEIFFNRQSAPNTANPTGAAAVRIYTFNLDKMQVDTTTYSLDTQLWLTTAANQFSFNANLFKGANGMQISGTWGPVGTAQIIGPEKTAGGNHFDAFTNLGQYLTGPITGTFTQTVTLTIHTGKPTFVEIPPYDFSWRIYRTIDATIDGKSGMIVMSLICKGTTTSGRTLEGTWVIMSATDGLTGLHGEGTWWNIPQNKLGYEGKLHFTQVT